MPGFIRTTAARSVRHRPLVWPYPVLDLVRSVPVFLFGFVAARERIPLRLPLPTAEIPNLASHLTIA